VSGTSISCEPSPDDDSTAAWSAVFDNARVLDLMRANIWNGFLHVTVQFDDDGKNSRLDRSRGWCIGATETLFVEVLASLFSQPRGKKGYLYLVREASNTAAKNPAELTMKHERSRSEGVARGGRCSLRSPEETKNCRSYGDTPHNCSMLTSCWLGRRKTPVHRVHYSRSIAEAYSLVAIFGCHSTTHLSQGYRIGSRLFLLGVFTA
jgi:hypothetical protein